MFFYIQIKYDDWVPTLHETLLGGIFVNTQSKVVLDRYLTYQQKHVPHSYKNNIFYKLIRTSITNYFDILAKNLDYPIR